MSVKAISDFFGLALNDWKPNGIEMPACPIIEIDGLGLSEQSILSQAILHTYDIRKDDVFFRLNTEHFEQQRGDYPTRREFPAYTVIPKNIESTTIDKLKKIGFNIEA